MPGIIATLGPASATKEIIRQLHAAGVTIFRCNFAHDTPESTLPIMRIIHELEQEHKVHIAMMIDVEGPGIRTGALTQEIPYKQGETFPISVTQGNTDPKGLFCDYQGLIDDVQIGTKIKIDAGRFIVQVKSKAKDHLIVQAQNDFVVGSRRHINLPGVHVHLPSFTDKDKSDVLFAIQQGFDYVALSFVRSAEDMQELRKFLRTHGGEHMRIIAKIENQEGLDNCEAIAQASDLVMVARGDLGTELDIRNIPEYQLRIISATKNHSKRVIVATEMLESMIHNSSPTRAEVSDVFYAVVEGADYVMLSGETAVGEYPIETVAMMKKIIHSAENFE